MASYCYSPLPGYGLVNKEIVIASQTLLNVKISLLLYIFIVFSYPFLSALVDRILLQAGIIFLTPDTTALATLVLLSIFKDKKFGCF